MDRYFAKVEEGGTISKVLVVGSEILDPISFITQDANEPGVWLETWQEGGERKNFASVGFLFDKDLNAFVAPKLEDNFIFDAGIAKWVPPVPKPEGDYYWDASTDTWEQSLRIEEVPV
jgi:hypothetical protein